MEVIEFRVCAFPETTAVTLIVDDKVFETNSSFTYYVAPTIFTISPAYGPSTGGTKVSVIGGNFFNSSLIRCKFGDDHIASGIYVGSSTISCVSPKRFH